MPKLLDMSPKILPVVTQFNDFRYFLIDGGRGGGKSQAIARWILYLAEKYKLRIVCGREVQERIEESVYTLLKDLILQYSLNFTIQSNRIFHNVSGTDINFRGLREQGAAGIQGMEGVDILWVDEAQSLTNATLRVLIPTLRKDNTKIIFTMNRFKVNDPAYSSFKDRDDCLSITLNYTDNPFCTNALKKEAQECREKSESDYEHVWLGKPLDKTEDQVFNHSELVTSSELVFVQKMGYYTKLAGFDIARFGSDKCACVVLQQMGALRWEVVMVEEWDHKDLNYTTGRILQIHTEQKIEKSIIDEDGIGSGPLDNLTCGRGMQSFTGFRNTVIGYQDDKFFGNNRTVWTYRLKDLIGKGHICIKDNALIEELETLRYKFDNNQRRILISKDEMKKTGVKSPNMADALIMAVSLIDDTTTSQDTQYVNRRQSTPDDNLFGIAGIR